jgi:hypothetical protein
MPQTLMSDALCTAVLREGITDAELRELVSHPRRWSYAVRDPHGSALSGEIHGKPSDPHPGHEVALQPRLFGR